MKHLVTAFCIVALSVGYSFAQIAQGPATGSIPSGVVVSTNNFSAGDGSYGGPLAKLTHNHAPVYPLPMPPNMPAPTGPEGSNYEPYHPDANPEEFPPIRLTGFSGIPQTNSIPPDPHMAVGPNHIITVVNTSFRISDKAGNTLKTINADSWFNTALPNPGAFDPKVHYDHFAGRWIMVWLNENSTTQTSYFLLSVSDDDDPLGTWYNWALPSNVNGSTNNGCWTDYEGVGFDSLGLYFTGNMFGFTTGYSGVKVRIIAKAQLYANTAGAVTWTDFWALRDLNNRDVFGTRPSVLYTTPSTNEYYLVGIPNLTGGTYFNLYRIANPLTSPTISCTQIAATSWTNAPNAGQLGGGSLAIETGGSGIRNEPIYRNGSIWITHSVNNGGYSSIRYLRINTATNVVTEDVALGAFGFWHFYDALQVDKDGNVALTFSRSGDTEYIGAFYTWRLSTELPGLHDAVTIQPGRANYVKDFGSGRNRWGDYNGIALDPTDRNNFWMHTEYAESPASTWGVYVQSMRLVPYTGARYASSTNSVDFGNVEVGFNSDTAAISVYNLGSSTLTVSSIVRTQSSYTLLNVPSLPTNIATFDSIRFKVVFTPTAHGTVNDSITIASNDGTSPTSRIILRGRGIVVGQAQEGVMYAASAVVGSTPSQMYSINTSTGAATLIGQTGVNEIDGLAIRPSTSELFGMFTNSNGSTLYRMSSQHGDALFTRNLGIPNLRAITFSLSGDTLYGGTTNGRLYRLNLTTGDTTYIGTASGKIYSGLAISPTSGLLWASVRPPLAGRDSIYTVDRTIGATTGIGRTGLNLITPYIAFNPNGNLFAIIGSGAQTNSLYSIDTLTAASTLIGSTGVTGIQAIAMKTTGVSGVEENPVAGIPTTFELAQNYPNPFNPTTQIQYGLPVQSFVRITIYNIVGQEIARIFEGAQSAGYHAVSWNGTTEGGIPAASGVYLYKLEAKGQDRSFVQTKKMLLLK